MEPTSNGFEYSTDEQMKDLAVVMVKDAVRFAKTTLSLDDFVEAIEDVLTVPQIKRLKAKL